MVLPAVIAFSAIQAAFAQEGQGGQQGQQVIINRVEVWGLFYKGMVIAFTVGAVIMGVIAYVVFRFRESNPKNVPRGSIEEGGHH